MDLLPAAGHCPYCDAPLELLINPEDTGVEYIEDCQVCCQPIRITAAIDSQGELTEITLLREDE